MRLNILSLPFALAGALAIAALPAIAAEPFAVTAADMHLEYLRPATMTYLVYNHGGPGTGVNSTMLATSEVTRETTDGIDAWVITQRWENDSGTAHTARTVHAARDLATLSQEATWNRDGASFATSVDPSKARGTVEGELSDAARERMHAGFATMDDGWWFNWHSDLVLLPLLPYERGGTLRVHLFDVGMAGPEDVDYTVIGERTLFGADGAAHECWLVETDSGGLAGSGNYQRFWVDKDSRLVLKEEDVFDGQYRSKVLLSVPVVTEFPLPAKP